eukprot:TRINITY_DN7825_c0_g1_i1.p1 TRINITY_DN7825_c0_g1~~TRINITY_DN7825_c0_g1_i1.p1  ORF type:complete len:480 (+),score=47.40 TRINITY_DN7825_c0_g1_i1:38-1441(+)
MATLEYVSKPENQNQTADAVEMPPCTACLPSDPNKHVDGPFAWLQVVAAFMTTFLCLGIYYAVGVFVQPYADEFHVGSGSAGLVLTFQSIGFFLPAPLAGNCGDRFGPHVTQLIGTLFVVVGLLLASFSSSMWGIWLTHGLIAGTGFAFQYYPTMATVTQWFVKRRSLAAGIAASGSGFGNFVFALLADRLLSNLGRRTTLRILAGAAGVCGVLPAVIIRRRLPPPRKDRQKWSVTIRRLDFWMLSLSNCFYTFGYLFPFLYLPKFATAHGMSRSFGAQCVSFMGLSSACGRIIYGFIRYKPRPLMTGAVAFITVVLAVLPALTTKGLLMGFSVLYGFTAGSFISLLPVMVAQLFGIAQLGSLLGAILFTSLFGSLASPAVCGAMYDNSGTWTPAVELCAATLFMSVVFLLLLGLPCVKHKASVPEFTQVQVPAPVPAFSESQQQEEMPAVGVQNDPLTGGGPQGKA